MKKNTIISLLLACLMATTLFLGGCSKGNSSGGFNVIVLGHVGHGKSEVTASIASAYGQKVSVDQLNNAKESKSGSVTYHAQSVSVKSDSRTYSIYDLPDYKDICKSIASQGIEPEGAILVVSMRDGIMPQTAEHIKLINGLGIRNVVVYISNCTDPDDSLLGMLKEDINAFGINADYEFVVDCDNFSAENAKKTVSAMDKWTSANEPKTVSGTSVDVYAYQLSEEEGGKNAPLITNDELEITINNKTYKGRLASVVGDMMMPGDSQTITLELDESVSVKVGDKVTAKKDGTTYIVGVIVE